MPPMARTSRTGVPSVDALDNLDLDDMFAGDDVALFDGLDIDLDNMDDIAGMDDAKLAPMAIQPLEQESLQQQQEEANDSNEGSPRRRKAKRKTKAPFFFDQEDEDYIDDKKKRKRGAKGVTKKKGARKVSASADDSKQPPVAAQKISKGGKTKASPMPPPLARGIATAGSSVAAAGQFGGRRKRGPNSAFAPKKAKSKSTAGDGLTNKLKKKTSSTSFGSSRSSPVPPAVATAAATTASTLQQIQTMHAQNSFCGLLPSNTLFYPFMPTMPPEPSMKNRKVFPLCDRIYSSFTGHLNPIGKPTTNGVARASDSDPIFKLLQDALKDEKSATPTNEKAQLIGNAVGALRRTISQLEKPRIAADLYGVCALLKRQHDFLKQNSANMEKWCKDSLPEGEYAAVYQPIKALRKRKGSDALTTGSSSAGAGGPPIVPSVLASFGTPLLRVKLVCSGFKDPKSAGPLLAQLPALFLPMGGSANDASSKAVSAVGKPTKKRKLSSSVVDSMKLMSGGGGVATATVPVVEEAPTYVEMNPNARRKHVADLIARVAKEIEAKHLQRMDERRVAFERQQNDLLKVAKEEEVLVVHTSGMWRWIEASGYFGNSTDEELNRRFDGIRSYDIVKQGRNELSRGQEGCIGQKLQANTDEPLFDRLQSLLVEEETEDSGDEEALSDDENDDDLYIDMGGGLPVSQVADLSGLSLDERLFLHVRSIGLAESLLPPLIKSSAVKDEEAVPRSSSTPLRTEAKPNYTLAEEDDLEDVIGAMTADLDKVSGLNNRRADFLELVATSNRLSAEDSKRKADAETSAFTKFQNLLKKTKEKAKNGNGPKALKNDANALPW